MNNVINDIQIPVLIQSSPSVRELFSVAMYLKDQVAAFPSVLEAWPPTACDITDEVWERAVPSELFNFISIRAPKEPIECLSIYRFSSSHWPFEWFRTLHFLLHGIGA